MKRLGKLKILYETNRWDGPLAGMCEVDGERYYFKCLNEEEAIRKYYEEHDGEPPLEVYENGVKLEHFSVMSRARVFGIYNLTEEEWAHEDWKKELFKTHVRDGKELRPRKEWDKFYKHPKVVDGPKIKLTNDKMIGTYLELNIYD